MKNIVSLKRKHCRYKPGSVQQCVHCCACHLSNPYVTTRLKHSTLHRSYGAFGRTTLITMVYMNLQPPEGTARRSPGGWWSLTPPSHPYSNRYGAVVLFCLILLSPTASIFGSGVSCAARTFLSYTNICVPATSRSSVSECKGTAKEWKNKINCDLFFSHKFCLLSFFFYISVSIGV